jgi:hypothetical protein
MINFVFTVIIVVLTIVEIKLILKRSEVSIKGSILALGILGTFVGIFIGLQDFNSDPTYISNSIANIIEGLKIAFYTSIIGMGASIGLTLLSRRFPPIEQKDDEAMDYLKIIAKNSTDLNSKIEDNHQSTKDILQELQVINSKIVNNTSVYNLVDSINTNMISKLDSIKLTVENSSKTFVKSSTDISENVKDSIKKLIHELYYIQTNLSNNIHDFDLNFKSTIELSNQSFENNINALSDNFKDMFKDSNRVLDIALDNLSKKSANEISKALKWSIEEFNSSMTEGFGENFKKLEESLVKMLLWQDNYKDYIQKSENQLLVAIKSIEDFEKIMSKHDEIPDIYKKLETIIDTFDKQVIIQNNNLATFINVANEAKNAIPNLNNYFESLQKELLNITKAGETNFNKYDQFLRDSMKNTDQSIQNSIGNLTGNLAKLDKQMSVITDKFSLEYEAYIEAIKKTLQQAGINYKRP